MTQNDAPASAADAIKTIIDNPVVQWPVGVGAATAPFWLDVKDLLTLISTALGIVLVILLIIRASVGLYNDIKGNKNADH